MSLSETKYVGWKRLPGEIRSVTRSDLTSLLQCQVRNTGDVCSFPFSDLVPPSLLLRTLPYLVSLQISPFHSLRPRGQNPGLPTFIGRDSTPVSSSSSKRRWSEGESEKLEWRERDTLLQEFSKDLYLSKIDPNLNRLCLWTCFWFNWFTTVDLSNSESFLVSGVT